MKDLQTKSKTNQQKQSDKQAQLIYKYGNCIFKQPIVIDDLPFQSINFYNQETINLSKPTIDEKKCFKQISQFKLSKLTLKNDEQTKIIKQIISIKFYNLIYLNLEQNKITNIEFIEQMQCPKLNYLCLNNNDINNLKAMNKIIFNQILSFNFTNNKIVHVQHSERIKINKFANLILKQKQANNNKDYSIQQQDDSYLAQFQSTFYKNQHWQANSNQKIIQRKIWDILYYKDLKKLQKPMPERTTDYFGITRNR